MDATSLLDHLRKSSDRTERKVIDAVAEYLVEACKFSAKGDIDFEWKRLFRGERWAKQESRKQGLEIYKRVKEEFRKNGLILKGAEPLGELPFETALAFSGRSEIDARKSGVPEFGETLHVFSDRLCQGEVANRITPQTQFAIFVDGAEHYVSKSTGTAAMGIKTPVPFLGLAVASSQHRNERLDARICYFIAADVDWQMSVFFHPSELAATRLVCQRLDLAKSDLTQKPNSAHPKPGSF